MRLVDKFCDERFGFKFSQYAVNLWFVIAVHLLMTDNFLFVHAGTVHNSKLVETASIKVEEQFKGYDNDCLGTKCDCTVFSPKISGLQAKQINETTLEVSWEIGFRNRRYNNLSDIIFHLLNSKKQRSYLPVYLNRESLKNNFLILNASVTEGLYTLEAKFFNNYSCSVVLTSEFRAEQVAAIYNEKLKAQDVKQNQGEEEKSKDVYKETNSNLTVDVVCVKEEHALRFNLKWNVTAEDTSADFYEITYDTVPTESPTCNMSTDFSYKYEGLTSVMVPPPNQSSNVLGNCTYGVTVRSYKKKILPVLMSMYTAKLNVPGCVDVCCNCSIFKPKLSNLSITRINLTKYIVSWESDSRSENNFTSITFYIKNSDVPVLNVGPGSFNENYTILVFKITTGFFTLVADYLNIYNCTTTLSATFGDLPTDYADPQTNYEEFQFNYEAYSETTTDKNQSSIVKDYDYSVIPADQITSLSVNTFCDPNEHIIKFNLTWDKPEGNSPPHQYNFIYQVVSNELHPCLEGQKFNYEYGHENLTQMVIPPQDYIESVRIQGNCTYQISVIALNKQLLHNNEDIFVTEVDIPPCVGSCCNCDVLFPNPENVTVTHINSDRYKVSWNSKNHKSRNNFTNVTFDLKNPEMPLPDIGPKGYKEDFKYVEINVTAGNYTLIADFVNNYTCPNTLYIPFEVIQHKPQGTKLWIQLLIIFSISIAVLVLLLCFFNMRTNIIKDFIFLRFRNEARRDVRNLYLSIPTASNRKMENSNWLYVDQEIIEGNADEFEFPRSRLTLIKEIGKGAFGQVFLAKSIDNEGSHKYVAIKTLREHAPSEELDDFLSEIQILKRIGNHSNVVTLIGCCTLKEPYMMIMEFVPCGDLKQYLLDLRDQWHVRKGIVLENSESASYIEPESPLSAITTSTRPSVATQYTNLSEARTPRTPSSPSSQNHFTYEIDRVLDNNELQDFAFQIAKGMAHLEGIPITHRDLAARNILINEYKVLKISDFGLSRTGPYINNKLKKLPLRWMSVEAIEDHFYDNKSDVWAFAVVLWEIGTLGGFPYENIPDKMLIYYLNAGKRLARPEICTDDFYSLMLRCWSHDANLRPSFKELVDLLDAKKRRIYVDFSQLNPTYMFPPATNKPNFEQGAMQTVQTVQNTEHEVKYIEC